MAAPERRNVWGTLATLGTVLASSLVFVYLAGGGVIWYRINQADLPSAQALAYMSHETILAVGVREAIFPALFLTSVLVGIGAATRRIFFVEKTGRRLRGGPLSTRLRIFLGWFTAAVVSGFAFVSFDRYGVVWVLVVCLGMALWTDLAVRTPRTEPLFSGRRRVVLVVGALIVAAVSIAVVEVQSGHRLPAAHVRLKGSGPVIDGEFVGWSGGVVVIGYRHQLFAIPDSRVDAVLISRSRGPCPPLSLLERLVDKRFINRC